MFYLQGDFCNNPLQSIKQYQDTTSLRKRIATCIALKTFTIVKVSLRFQ